MSPQECLDDNQCAFDVCFEALPIIVEVGLSDQGVLVQIACIGDENIDCAKLLHDLREDVIHGSCICNIGPEGETLETMVALSLGCFLNF